ncbi:MAG TPA: flagellar basal body protein, partial [Modestobacter sp.]|nr:flagellar basal body protein [Modestobacter sp.]
MLRSMFSAISGLRAHQTKLDVAGNNIANVNTVGFKGSQTVFEDTLSQVL